MMKTINISLPKSLYEETKKLVKGRGYSSMSELMRDALRHILYPHLTENGFTPEFEEKVLKAAAEPVDYDTVLETPEDVRNYFLYLKNPPKKRKQNDQNSKVRHL